MPCSVCGLHNHQAADNWQCKSIADLRARVESLEAAIEEILDAEPLKAPGGTDG